MAGESPRPAKRSLALGTTHGPEGGKFVQVAKDLNHATMGAHLERTNLARMKTVMTRRQMIGTLASTVAVLAARPRVFCAESARGTRLGVCGYSYNLHWKAIRDGQTDLPFRDALSFLDYCGRLGAGGVQAELGFQEPGYAAKVRAKAEGNGMYFEGQTSLPKDQSDLSRFETALRACKEAGAEVVRTVAMGGRRYETFDSMEAFQQFTKRAWDSFTMVEPLLKKHKIHLAIENHKDWRAEELVDVLKRLSSEWVGTCVDFGNNLALLEEPMAVVEALAPFALSSHLKDMAVQEYEEGFLLSEVPLGEGFLNLKRIIAVLRKARPNIQFSLEMITRDPLKVPCLTSKYFASLATVPARDLAVVLSRVRTSASKQPLPHITGLSASEQLALEDALVRRSLTYARRELSL